MPDAAVTKKKSPPATLLEALRAKREDSRVESIIHVLFGVALLGAAAGVAALFPPAGLAATTLLVVGTLQGWNLVESMARSRVISKGIKDISEGGAGIDAARKRKEKLSPWSKLAGWTKPALFGGVMTLVGSALLAPAVLPMAAASYLLAAATPVLLPLITALCVVDGAVKGGNDVIKVADNFAKQQAETAAIAPAPDTGAPAPALTQAPSPGPSFSNAAKPAASEGQEAAPPAKPVVAPPVTPPK